MSESLERRIEQDTSSHIFANSPTMLALCLTAIGLIKIYANLQRITTLADNFLALASIAFLLATVFSYFALRAATARRRRTLARVADITFMAGLFAATAVGVFVSFALAG